MKHLFVGLVLAFSFCSTAFASKGGSLKYFLIGYGHDSCESYLNSNDKITNLSVKNWVAGAFSVLDFAMVYQTKKEYLMKKGYSGSEVLSHFEDTCRKHPKYIIHQAVGATYKELISGID
ncbi:hypothetical protein GT348_03800 [Aristophania vespae]|uniref:Uncharacterized protein n=1 Tax=Aristophania vespae TaxID=2697033 RepID=A0A6P1NAT1_9PROT|nr:hypothetical protein [Aristophania vespae]QHI95506.1 hypothetical protein GT348_03800 [Aristophania vespae]